MHPRGRIEYRIGALRAAGLWREPTSPDDPALAAGEERLVDARSNDYLGLAARGVSRETAVERLGAGASRLISGTWPAHAALEAALAEWLGAEACLVFSSGYAANVGAIGALAGPGETVLSDALNHASIVDGCRLSRADVVVLPHRDVAALERALANGHGVRWVVTESYFGMDGDSPDLAAMRRLCDAHDAALVVDEAHAVGVFGPGGRGLCAEQGVTPDVLVGGLGKAFGAQGGFVASRRLYRDWLWNRARSFVFSTAPSPLLCSLTRERIAQVQTAERERAHLRALESRLATALSAAGVRTPAGRHGPLFPIVLGSEDAVMAGAARAREWGVLCHPIRPPTVPRGGSRLRVTLRADMSSADVDRVAEALKAAWRERSDGKESGGAIPSQGPATAAAESARERVAGEAGAGGRATADLRGGGERNGRERGRSEAHAPTAGLGHSSDPSAVGEVWPAAERTSRSGTPEGAMAGDRQRGTAATAEREPDGAEGTAVARPVYGATAGKGATSADGGGPGAGRTRGAAGPERAGEAEERAAVCAGSDSRGAQRWALHTSAGACPSRVADSGSRASAGPGGGEFPSVPVESRSAPSRSASSDASRSGEALGGARRTVSKIARTWLVLGTGTEVGKTFVARELLRGLAAAGEPVAGLKPVETGLGAQGALGDASQLEALAFHVKLPVPHPLYGFADPVTPSRAARSQDTTIDLRRIVAWVNDVSPIDQRPAQIVVETAGGVFSPLADQCTNFDLAMALEPAIWILVAPNRLGVLHDVTSTLHATTALGRRPDYIVLSAPETPDSSTSSNRDELRRLSSMPPIIELPRNDPRPLEALIQAIAR